MTLDKSLLKIKQGLFSVETELLWFNILMIGIYHIAAVYCALTFEWFQNWKTLAWMYATYIASGFGVTAGVHRYWTHRSYKATKGFQVLLVITYLMSGQNRIRDWVRDHRVHHKYTDTAADPHDSTRGFFFSHVGWLMMKKKPEVIEKGRQIDMSDILNDPIVTFVDRHFTTIKLWIAFIIPSLIPIVFWNETVIRAFVSQAIIRYVLVLNCSWSVNSAAHAWGFKPYNKTIKPSENPIVSVLSGGEGWHNFHHVFPFDYRASEHGSFAMNLTLVFLNTAAKFGLVYDMKKPSDDLIKKVMKRQGDGSRPIEEFPFPLN